MTRHWYRVAVAPATGAPVLVAASGEHLGEAIALAEAHVGGATIGIDAAPEADIPLGDSVGKQHVLDAGAADSELPVFRWPVGVAPALGAAGQVAGAARGFIVRDDPELLVIEAQTDRDHVVDLFLGLVERVPAADNLEVRLLDHFEDRGATDVWLTSRINAKKAIRFLDDHDEELIWNGHVELSVYVRAHRATLRLSEHKTVLWLAEGRALQAEVIGWMGELGVPRRDSLVTVRNGAHFHYRPAKSRARKKLADELFRQRLRRVDTVKKKA